VDKSIEFTARPGNYFWSNGYAWGTCTIGEKAADLKVLHGSLTLNKFRLSDGREAKLKNKTVTDDLHIILENKK